MPLAPDREITTRSENDWSRFTGEIAPAADVDPWLAATLHTFDPITLDQMARVALMDRREIKYVMPQAVLLPLLRDLHDSYRVLSIAGERTSHYRTLYYDTADLALFRRHHAGAPDRYKIRAREYVDSQLTYFEVKHRTARCRTIKSRIPTPSLVTAVNGPAGRFLSQACPYAPGDLQPCLWNEFTRITLVSDTKPERITLDLDLAFHWNGIRTALPGVVVAEVKYTCCGTASPFVAAVRTHHIRPTSFSKYCVGVSLLYPTVKSNRFKAKRLLIERMMRGDQNGIH